MNEELEALLERWPLARELHLPQKSVVVVAGCYKGVTMELLLEMYPGIIIHGFEPQIWAALEAQTRLDKYLECYVHDYGIGLEEAYRPMGEWATDACSFVNTGPGSREQGFGQMYDVDLVFHMLHLEEIELFVVNMEGYEFDLLPYMEHKGWFDKIRKLAVQFHEDIGHNQNYDKIVESLDKRYSRIVDDLPAWGYWANARR